MDCLRQGRQESAMMPLEETLSIMRTLDAARALWGLRYPGGEKKRKKSRVCIDTRQAAR
jgi:hypothetical protein